MPAKKTAVVVGGSGSVSSMLKDWGFKIVGTSEQHPDLVVYTGGADVDPQLYGEPRLKETSISAYRDEIDLGAWEKWEDRPKLGICRGAQFLNVMSGGKLFQHVTGHRFPHQVYNLLPEIAKEVFSVSSTHHQMMIPAVTGETILIARQLDIHKRKGLSGEYLSGVPRDAPEFDTEGVWYNDTQSLCFQFHPEYTIGPETRYMPEYTRKMVNHFFF